MRMLHAGGVECVADNQNSFEDKRALELPGNSAWLDSCGLKAVKILEPQKWRPPSRHHWYFIWCERDPLQQARSQMKFLRAMRVPIDNFATDRTRVGIIADTPKVRKELLDYPRRHLMVAHFEETLSAPMITALAIDSFLRPLKCHGLKFDPVAASKVVIPRAPECYDGFLELDQIAKDPSAP